MNISDLKISGKNELTVNDSNNAPLLKISIKSDGETVLPEDKTLEIMIKKSQNQEGKKYVYTLPEKLLNNGSVSNEFLMEPVYIEGKVLMKARFIKRISDEGTILTDEVITDIDSEALVMNSGVNYVSTNYNNALIEIIYPKNTDLVNLFLNTAIYGLDSKKGTLTIDDIYFKDCFTDDLGEINAEFNELKAKCLSSKSGNFRIDSMGNITCNTIITTGENTNTPSINFSDVYPVGSIYLTVVDTNPSTYFGGTWERIKDRFILASGDSYAPNTTGGSSSHTHEFYHSHNVPGTSHSHTLSDAFAYISIYAKQVFIKKRSGVESWNDTYQMTGSSYSTSGTGSSNTTGTYLGGSTDSVYTGDVTTNSQSSATTSGSSNIPPYISVYVWKRTA